MTCMTGYNLAINYTSVEAIQRGGISNIAFLVSQTSQTPTAPPTPPTSSKSSDPKDSNADDDWPLLRVVQRDGGRTFVVMQTKAFQHPWATSLMQGWQDTMGNNPVEWFLPFKHSPCKQKGRSGEFRWGEVVYEMATKYEKEHPGTQLALLEGRR
jgi:palmitoyltransferase